MSSMGTYKEEKGLRFRIASLVYDRSVAIFNSGGAASDCPSEAADMCNCSDDCYARDPEKIWKGVLRFRRRQRRSWKRTDANTFAAALTSLYEKYAVKFLRFNESSDFWGQDDVDKFCEIQEQTPVTIFGYTANPFLDYTNINFNLKLSQPYVVDGVTGSVIVIPKGSEVPKGYMLCPKTSGRVKRCTDNCGVCFTSKKVSIAMYKH